MGNMSLLLLELSGAFILSLLNEHVQSEESLIMVVHNAPCGDVRNGLGPEWHWKGAITTDEEKEQSKILFPKNDDEPEKVKQTQAKETLQQRGLEENIPSIEMDATDLFYDSLINKARFIPGDDSDLVTLEEIPWVDKSLINESSSFHRKFFALVILSNTSALMFGFAIKPNSAVLLKTGKLHNPELSFQRYLSTIQRIGKFFTFPFNWDEAHKAFQTVRKMHVLASKQRLDSSTFSRGEHIKLDDAWKTELALAIRNDLKYIDTSSAPTHALTWNPPVAVSQFDMAITQFGFFGTMWLFPNSFGVKNRDKEMKGVIHVWAIFGRLLGIRDEFNICLKLDPLLYQKIFTNVIIESLKTMDETVVTIQSAFAEAFSKRMPFATYKSMLYLGLKQNECYKGENLWNLMSWKDKACVKFMDVFFWMMKSSGVFRIFVNLLLGIWLQVQFWLHLPNAQWPSPQFLSHKMK